MRQRKGLLVLAVVGLVVQGCGLASDAGPAVTVTDSAGVRLVHHQVSRPPPSWSTVTDGVRSLEGDPDSPMFEIGSAIKLRDGRYAVADGGNARVVFFDASGTLTSTTGRSGEGPGEFQHLTLLARGAADSILVWDRQLRRVSVLAPTGDFAHSFSLESTEDVPFASVSGVYADGSFLATGAVDTGGGAPATGRQIYSSPAFHFGPDGTFRSNTGVFPTSESYYEVGDRGFSVFPVLFGRQAFRLTAGNQLIAATSDRYELRFHAPDGALTMIVRRESRDRPVTSEARRSLVERLVQASRAGQQDRLRTVLSQMEVPEYLPEFSDVFADPLARIWVREYEVEDGPLAEWRVYDGEGLAIGSISLPARFTPTDAGADFVVGITTDDLDVETVVEYPIHR